MSEGTKKDGEPGLFVHISHNKEKCKDGKKHQWDGPEHSFDGGCGSTSTCSKCGMDAISWSMRYGL